MGDELETAIKEKLKDKKRVHFTENTKDITPVKTHQSKKSYKTQY